MTVRINITVHSDNPDTIWNRLAAKLGRQPTRDEASAEVKRILAETAQDRRLRHARAH